MSEIERHIGTIKKVDLNGMSVEDRYKKEREKRTDEPMPSYFDTWKEYYDSLVYPTIAVEIDGEIWDIVNDKEEKDYESINIVSERKEDGSYDYLMQYYNGRTCLNEMLYEGIQNLKKREKAEKEAPKLTPFDKFQKLPKLTCVEKVKVATETDDAALKYYPHIWHNGISWNVAWIKTKYRYDALWGLWFDGETIEEAIDKAYDYCVANNLITED